jgi:hypothetical protein
MITHDLRIGLNVLPRLMTYEDAATGTVRLGYDLSPGLMNNLRNDDIAAAAKKLDAKVEALARTRNRHQTLASGG